MKKTLIATKPDDIHAITIKLALNKLGYVADLWYTADFPSKSTYSFEIEKNKFSWLTNASLAIHDDDYDIIWYRRAAKPVMPGYLHPEDASNAKKEVLTFFNSVLHSIFPAATWINPLAASKKAASKLLQLKIADHVKLNIPETLISNDAGNIKNFIKKHAAIYKTIYPVAWNNEHEMRLTYTNNITLDDLTSDKILQCTPGIFQRKIEKKYELRVTYFGDKYIAVKIDSQKLAETKLDWRIAPPQRLILEQVELPESINQACKKLMQELGIVFGCFDFIVTPDDEYYFLEVNEQGQFLWIEANNPDIKMLEAFIEFITNNNIPISLLDVSEESMRFMEAALKNHVNPQPFGETG